MKKFIKNHAGALVTWAAIIAIIAAGVIAIIIAIPYCPIRYGVVSQKDLVPIVEQGHRVEITEGTVMKVEQIIVCHTVNYEIHWQDANGDVYRWQTTDKDEGEKYHKGDALWYWEEYKN